jgi:hypothetical protein
VEVKEEMQYSPFSVVAVPFTQIRLADAFSFLCYIYPTISLSERALHFTRRNAMGFNGEKQRIMLINGEGDVIQIVMLPRQVACELLVLFSTGSISGFAIKPSILTTCYAIVPVLC